MLEKKGQGTTLEELSKIKGGIIGLCGTDCCGVCGERNESRLSDAFAEWEREDF